MEQALQKKEAVSRAIQDALELQDPNVRSTPLSNDYMQQQRTSFVSYGTFLEEYWSHFPQTLTKGLGTLCHYDSPAAVVLTKISP